MEDHLSLLTFSVIRFSLLQVNDTEAVLRSHGIQPSAQRMAVAGYVLQTDEHPSADVVFRSVRERFPYISRATVYNTLNLLVEKGLLQALRLAADCVVFDPKVEAHHHFIDDRTGTIHDVPREAVQVSNIDSLTEFDIRGCEVILRGRRR
jgi:Fur family transcriptional regulator, iron response regulator